MNVYSIAYNPNGIYKQIDGIGNFVSIGASSSINWMGGTEAYNGDIYACAYNYGNIYKQTGGAGNFISLNQTLRNWHSMAANVNGDIYCATEEGGIYKQTNGTGDFILVGQIPSCHGICITPDNDLYACAYNVGIYKQINCTGDFILVWSTVKIFRGITSNANGDIYITVLSGDIYKSLNGADNFIALNQTIRNWEGICSTNNSDVFANVYDGDIYKQINSANDFIALGQTTRYWRGIWSTPYIDISIHKKSKLLNIATIGFKHESNPYTPENITSTDYHYSINSDIKINTEIGNYLQKICTGNYSKFPSITGKKLCAVNFSIDLYAMSDVTIAPSYFDILRSCGWKQLSISGGVAIFPDSLYNRISATIEVSFPEEDTEPRQIVYKISGAMGYVKFTGETGKPIKAEFSFIGAFESITTRSFEDFITPSNFDNALPIALLGATFQLFDTNVSLDKFEINSGEIINLFSNIMRHHGYDGTRITDRNTIGTLILNSDAELPEELYNKIVNNEQGNFLLVNRNLNIIASNVKVESIEDDIKKIEVEFPENITFFQGVANMIDKLYDELGNLLIQGISNVIHLLTGKTITVDSSLTLNVNDSLDVIATTDLYGSCDCIEIDAVDQQYYYAGNEIVLAIENNGNLQFTLGGIGSTLKITNLKSGSTQVNAGAVENEVYRSTLTDANGNYPLCIGV
jgi:hypothetical protein